MDDIQKMEELERICLRTIRDYSWDTVYFKDINSNYIWNSKKHAARNLGKLLFAQFVFLFFHCAHLSSSAADPERRGDHRPAG